MVGLSAIIEKSKNLSVAMNQLSIAGVLSTFIAISSRNEGLLPLTGIALMGL